MINYILQIILFQALFLAVYDLFLQKETFFKANRLYLLGTAVLSFLLPLIKIPTLQQQIVANNVVQLPEVIINPEKSIVQTTTEMSVASFNYLTIIYYAGALLMLCLFIIKFIKIIKLIKVNKKIKEHNLTLVLLPSVNNAFSFFNYIFINPSLLKNNSFDIVKHEKIHCKQYHTVDLLFFEILKIVQWFNPLIYIYQKRITVLHEYIADAQVLKTCNKQTYFNNLLSETFNVENISFINQFYTHSLIKKRIVMITKERSAAIKKFKYLLIIPLLLAMLTYTSCSNDSLSEEEIQSVLKATNGASDKYLEIKNGNLAYIGKSLEGKRISIDNYTEDELRFYDFINEKSDSKILFEVVIDTDGNRVMFLKSNFTIQPKPSAKDYTNLDVVPFAVIDKAPTFPGCEEAIDLKECMKEAITTHVATNFNPDVSKGLGLEVGISKIFVIFTINKQGEISDVKARAAHQNLQDEAIRVIEALPKMVPGEHNGKAVSVKYSLPIAFKIE